MDNAKVTPDVMNHLKNAGVELKPYDSILTEVKRQVWLKYMFMCSIVYK